MEKEEWKGLMAARLDKEAREAQQRAAAALEKQRDDEIEVRGGGGGDPSGGEAENNKHQYGICISVNIWNQCDNMESAPRTSPR